VAANRANPPVAFSRQARLDRGPLLRLKPQLFAALSDVAPDVRTEAIVAIGNLEFDPDRPSPPAIVILSQPFTTLLVTRYGLEQVPSVRSEIIKALALSDYDGPRPDAVLVKALDDSSPFVIQFALRGIVRFRIAQALPKLAALLGDDRSEVRLAMPDALAAFGAEAAPYVEALRKAASLESDPILKAGILRAVDTIVRAGRKGGLSPRVFRRRLESSPR
jgi:HEAT repeat protein